MLFSNLKSTLNCLYLKNHWNKKKKIAFTCVTEIIGRFAVSIRFVIAFNVNRVIFSKGFIILPEPCAYS